MRRLKQWLISEFLPVYLKESILKENAELRSKVADLEHRLETQRAYSAGLEYALRRRITIRNEVQK